MAVFVVETNQVYVLLSSTYHTQQRLELTFSNDVRIDSDGCSRQCDWHKKGLAVLPQRIFAAAVLLDVGKNDEGKQCRKSPSSKKIGTAAAGVCSFRE